MTLPPLPASQRVRHRRRVRLLVAAAAGLAVVQGAAAFALPRLRPPGVPAGAVTAAAAVAALWLGFRVSRWAGRWVAAARDRYAAGGGPQRLLADHLRIYVGVAAVLETIGLLGLAVAVWGAGPGLALWFQGLQAVLALLAWPTERKLRLYLQRAEAARLDTAGEGNGA